MRCPWTCQESVGNLGTPKLSWGRSSRKSRYLMAKDLKKQLQLWKENFKCQWGHWPFLLVKESVATPLWGSCEVVTHTPENGTWESSGTLENSEHNYRGQNTLHWGVLYTVGKVLKCRCPKWLRMNHLDICRISYGRKKGRESNWQLDSRPLKVENRPDSSVCKWSATHCWKALDKSYNFGLDLVPIWV
jgi:hypothetical protein